MRPTGHPVAATERPLVPEHVDPAALISYAEAPPRAPPSLRRSSTCYRRPRPPTTSIAQGPGNLSALASAAASASATREHRLHRCCCLEPLPTLLRRPCTKYLPRWSGPRRRPSPSALPARRSSAAALVHDRWPCHALVCFGQASPLSRSSANVGIHLGLKPPRGPDLLDQLRACLLLSIVPGQGPW